MILNSSVPQYWILHKFRMILGFGDFSMNSEYDPSPMAITIWILHSKFEASMTLIWIQDEIFIPWSWILYEFRMILGDPSLMATAMWIFINIFEVGMSLGDSLMTVTIMIFF